jgi:hypothetical protein
VLPDVLRLRGRLDTRGRLESVNKFHSWTALLTDHANHLSRTLE